MAYINTNTAAQSHASDRFTSLFAGFAAALQRRRVYSQTVNELRSLSDRDLSDLGIHRSLIASVAREAAYGK